MKKLQRNFKYIMDNHNSLFVLFDGTYNIIYANKAYCNSFGKNSKQLIGTSILSLIHPDEREMVKTSLAGLTPRKPSLIHQERIISESGLKWVDWSSRGIFSIIGKLEYFVGIGIDITPQKELESELLIIQNRYRQAEILGKVGNWEYDISKNIIWGSEGSHLLYGFSKDTVDFTPDTVEDRIPDRIRVHQALVDLIERDKPYDIEFEILPLDRNEPRFVSSQAQLIRDENGNPQKVVGVLRDITEYRNAMELLKDSEKRNYGLFELASEAIYIMSESGKVIDVNQAACEMLGRTKEEMLKLHVFDIDPAFPQDTFIDYWNDIPLSVRKIFTTNHLHKDGHLIPTEISGSKLKIGDQIYFYGIARDISRQLIAEEKLRESEERFKLAVEGTQDGLWDWDLRTGYAYHSDRFATMLGYEPEELPYTSAAWSDLLHPDDKDKTLKKAENYLYGSDEIYDSTFRMKCKGDYYRWIKGRGKAVYDENGKPYRFVGFNTDITNRKNAEKSFIKSTEKFYKLFETLLEGVVFFNQEGKITDANPAALRILGSDILKLKGKVLTSSAWNIVDKNNDPMTNSNNPVIQTLKTGKNINNVIVGMKIPDGTKQIWLSVNTVAIFEDDTEYPTKVYATFIDITDKRLSEENVIRLTDTLQAATEIAGLGHWTFDIKTLQPVWSDKMFEILGLQKNDGTPDYHSHKDFIHPDDWSLFNDSAQKCMQGIPYDIILRVIFPDGTIHYLQTIGKPRYNQSNEVVELFGTSQDITKIKADEIELKRHKENLEELVQERTKELEDKNDTLNQYYELFNVREFRIKELKDEVADLKAKLAEKENR